jgi:hypothetical protein
MKTQNAHYRLGVAVFLSGFVVSIVGYVVGSDSEIFDFGTIGCWIAAFWIFRRSEANQSE